MKILYVATVRSHIGQFHMPFINRLKELGCSVDGAYKDNSEQKQGLDTSALDNVYEIPFSRSPYSFSNVKAYFALKKVIDSNNYDLIHCHTPMGAVVTRLAARKAHKKGTKIVYTAHGFHFYNGAPSMNWRFFYPVEKYLAKFTDCLVTINNEDYERAINEGFKAGKICKVDGVGVDLSSFAPVSVEQKLQLREEYGYDKDAFIMIYTADFCKRKNQIMLLKALKDIVTKHNNVKLLCPGLTEYVQEAQDYINENKLGEYVDILGYRRDIPSLVGLSDISVSTARQEGLPINLIEAMAMGNPIVASDVRGNNDLVSDGINGYLVKIDDSDSLAEKIEYLINNPDIMKDMSAEGIKMSKKYSVENAVSEMEEIYKSLGIL